MGRGRTIFPIALACSLALHALATAAYMGYWSYSHNAIARSRPLEIGVKFVDPDLDEMGDANGTGIGSNSSPGDRPLQAREADEDQALLSRDPVGVGRIGGSPEQYTGPVGEGGRPRAMAMPAPPVAVATPPVAPSPATPQLQSPPPPDAQPPSPAAAMPAEDHPTLPAPKVEVADAIPDLKPPLVQTPVATEAPRPPAKQPVAAAVQQQARNDRRPGIPTPAADPLPQSDADSDPFSRISNAAVFHDGRLDVRKGRKVKTVRPQLGIGGIMDAIALNNPTVVLEIHIDPTGRVSDVEFVRNSGSAAIDDPTRNAVYQWWFEPARNKSGKPIADVILFTIEFR